MTAPYTYELIVRSHGIVMEWQSEDPSFVQEQVSRWMASVWNAPPSVFQPVAEATPTPSPSLFSTPFQQPVENPVQCVSENTPLAHDSSDIAPVETPIQTARLQALEVPVHEEPSEAESPAVASAAVLPPVSEPNTEPAVTTAVDADPFVETLLAATPVAVAESIPQASEPDAQERLMDEVLSHEEGPDPFDLAALRERSQGPVQTVFELSQPEDDDEDADDDVDVTPEEPAVSSWRALEEDEAAQLDVSDTPVYQEGLMALPPRELDEMDSLQDLLERAPKAAAGEDFLVLTSYFLQHVNQNPHYALKEINLQLVKAGLTPVTHGTLAQTLEHGFLSMVPDLDGTSPVAEFKLTEQGSHRAYELLTLMG